MGNFFFSPANLTVEEGDTVQWINTSSSYHTTTSGTGCSPDGLWDSGLIAPGGDFILQFNNTGTYPYYCTPHCGLGMTGTITVNPAVDVKEKTSPSMEKLDLSVSPIPSRGVLNIEFYIPYPGNVHIDILDIQGRKLTVIYNGFSSEGDHRVTYTSKDISDGVYFIRLSTEYGTTLRRILITD